jgi:hypothetical protein
MSLGLWVYGSVILITDVAMASGLWLRWPEWFYRKTKDSELLWGNVNLWGMSKSEESCARYIRFFCVVGIISQTICFFLVAGQK